MSVQLLVSAGSGPQEVRAFVARLAAAVGEALPVTSVASVDDPPRSAVLAVQADADALAPWLGTHALHERSRGQRARWFAAISLLPPALGATPALDPADVELRATRSGGPGGQHVNTTDSAVIARHRPSGLCVRVDAERSQHANRRLALQRLAEALAALDRAAEAELARERWRLHHSLVRGAPVAEWVVDGSGRMKRRAH